MEDPLERALGDVVRLGPREAEPAALDHEFVVVGAEGLLHERDELSSGGEDAVCQYQQLLVRKPLLRSVPQQASPSFAHWLI